MNSPYCCKKLEDDISIKPHNGKLYDGKSLVRFCPYCGVRQGRQNRETRGELKEIFNPTRR